MSWRWGHGGWAGLAGEGEVLVGRGRPEVTAYGVAAAPGDGPVECVEHAGGGDDGVQSEVLLEAVADPSFELGEGLRVRELEGEADAGGEDEPLRSGKDAVDAGQALQSGVVDGVVLQAVAGDVIGRGGYQKLRNTPRGE